MRFCSLLLFVCALSPGLAHSEVNEHLEYSYYDVTTRPDKPLFAQLNAASTIRENGQTFYGKTNWDVRWRFNWNTDESQICRITSATTVLRAVIILPRLNGASAYQSVIFDRFMTALRKHELGHYDIIVQGAQAIDNELHSLPGMRNCKDLEEYANTSASHILERHKERSRQYDRATGHGKTQGAWMND